MIRVETTISEESDDKLNQLCEKTGVTKRELVRRAIQSYCDQQALLNELLLKIEETNIDLFRVAMDNQQACVDATVRNYHAIQAISDRMTEIEKRLGIDRFSDMMKSRAVANAACFFTALLSSALALWEFAPGLA